MDLPPLDGLEVTAVEAINNTSIGNIVLDYLKFRSGTLNLLTAHNTYLEQLENQDTLGLTTQEIADELAKNSNVRLTFHVTPTITVPNFGEYVCAEIPNKIQQGEAISINFSVSEIHGGSSCEVQEGYLLINNPAADSIEKQQFRVDFDETTGGFPTYEFTAGVPNLVSPFQWGLEVKYYTANGDFLEAVTVPVVVEGSAAIPGYDVCLLYTSDAADE